jgi:hypothetical protein
VVGVDKAGLAIHGPPSDGNADELPVPGSAEGEVAADNFAQEFGRFPENARPAQATQLRQSTPRPRTAPPAVFLCKVAADRGQAVAVVPGDELVRFSQVQGHGFHADK